MRVRVKLWTSSHGREDYYLPKTLRSCLADHPKFSDPEVYYKSSQKLDKEMVEKIISDVDKSEIPNQVHIVILGKQYYFMFITTPFHIFL